MSRDQRIEDNWAIVYAQELARKHHTYVLIVFCLRKKFPFATKRLLYFLLRGLQEVKKNAAVYKIPFVFLMGDPALELPAYIHSQHVGALICDSSPLRIHKQWKQQLVDTLHIPFIEVDTHNIVPVWVSSEKREYGAYTIRPKIKAKLDNFLTEFPKLSVQSHVRMADRNIAWEHIESSVNANMHIESVDWIHPGASHATGALSTFLQDGIEKYDTFRNDPSMHAQSNLSPYLHFGQLSSQRVALEIKKRASCAQYSSSFLEEIIIRKELADNFCWYERDYDSVRCFPQWAQKTLSEHLNDPRSYLYSDEQLEHGLTHDPLWNAAEKELVSTGKMHGYLRMYWAKKILEWSSTPDEAMRRTVYLNDTYSLDGRDPNGYAGIAWAIGGVHDRPWFSRPVFGLIRYMSGNSIMKKYDCVAYMGRFSL